MISNQIIDKIKKLLALGQSSNPHEAAAALNKAQIYMAENEITMSSIEALEIKEEKTSANNAGRATRLDSNRVILLAILRKAFGVQVVFNSTNIQFFGHKSKDYPLTAKEKSTLETAYNDRVGPVTARKVRAIRVNPEDSLIYNAGLNDGKKARLYPGVGGDNNVPLAIQHGEVPE